MADDQNADDQNKVLRMAERQGFEPWVGLHPQRFSRPPRSTTPAPLRGDRRLRNGQWAAVQGTKRAWSDNSVKIAWRLGIVHIGLAVTPDLEEDD